MRNCLCNKLKTLTIREVPNNAIMTYNGAYPGGRPPVSYSALIQTPINVLALAFAQFVPSGGIDTSYLTDNPVWDPVGIASFKAAGGRIVLLSFGGGAAPGFGITGDPTTWAQTTVAALLPILAQYNLDGIDLDLESGVADSPDNYTALNGLNAALKAQGYIVSMAPQCTQIYPQLNLIDNAWNTYMPLYTTTTISNVDIIAPQFYNNCTCEYELEGCGGGITYLQWINLLQTGWTATYQGQSYMAQFSDAALKKIMIGKPATPDAADNGYQSPESLVAIYKNLVANGKTLGGFMYWSAEYDAPDFTFAKTLTQAFQPGR